MLAHPCLVRSLGAALCISLAAAPWPARADDTVRCENRNFRYHYCRADTDNRVRLQRQLSGSRCSEGDS